MNDVSPFWYWDAFFKSDAILVQYTISWENVAILVSVTTRFLSICGNISQTKHENNSIVSQQLTMDIYKCLSSLVLFEQSNSIDSVLVRYVRSLTEIKIFWYPFHWYQFHVLHVESWKSCCQTILSTNKGYILILELHPTTKAKQYHLRSMKYWLILRLQTRFVDILWNCWPSLFKLSLRNVNKVYHIARLLKYKDLSWTQQLPCANKR